VGFIASIATGRAVAARAAGKELLLEMGGNGPLVIMEDADLDAAVTATLSACFLNAGQSCTAGERILVHEDVRDEYLSLLTEALGREIRLGDPFDDATTMGPLNNEATVAKTERHVRDAVDRGAVVVPRATVRKRLVLRGHRPGGRD
jgi:acyl-CoA reductase-like NAD-dependent aldehyde dehydrogenase